MNTEERIRVIDEATALLEIETKMEPIIDSFMIAECKDFNLFLKNKVLELALEVFAISYHINTTPEAKSVILKEYVKAYDQLPDCNPFNKIK